MTGPASSGGGEHGDPRRRMVRPGGSLGGIVEVPGDKSVSHRALILGALAEGTSVFRGLSGGDDVRATAEAVQMLGASIVVRQDRGPLGWSAEVSGGRSRLGEPEDVIDCRNSGTAIRLLAGLAASLEGAHVVLSGDASLRRRPMDRITEPLRRVGALIDGRRDGSLAPLALRGRRLTGGDVTVPVPSAQVKSALLLAALGASGDSSVRERVPTRAHTEELLALAGARVRTSTGTGGGQVVRVVPGPLSPFELSVPRDPSQAAFWVVGALVAPDSEVRVPGVYVGPGRTGFLSVLERMGATVEVLPEQGPAGSGSATLVARSSELRGVEVVPEEVPGLVDEVPVLALAAALAEGESRFRGLGELRAKESDRVEMTAAVLRGLGAEVSVVGDDLVVVGSGGERLAGGSVSVAHDHRLVMVAAIAALVCRAPVEIDDDRSVATSYPGFFEELERCRR